MEQMAHTNLCCTVIKYTACVFPVVYIYVSMKLQKQTQWVSKKPDATRGLEYRPSAQGDAMSKVLLTAASSGGDPSSYTEKGTMILLPRGAEAVA